MLFLFSLLSIKLDFFVDGLENVEAHINATNQEANFFVENEHIFLFFQKHKHLKLSIINKGKKIDKIKNGFEIPTNSIVKAKVKWDFFINNINYNDFLIGFFDGSACDFIFYSNFPNESFPLSIFPKQTKCIYNFYKNQTQTENSKDRKGLFSIFSNSKKIKTKGLVKIDRKKPNLLAEYEPDEFQLKYTKRDLLPLGICLNIAGILIYSALSLIYGSDCVCCCKNLSFKLRSYQIDSGANDFYTETLSQQFHC